MIPFSEFTYPQRMMVYYKLVGEFIDYDLEKEKWILTSTSSSQDLVNYVVEWIEDPDEASRVIYALFTMWARSLLDDCAARGTDPRAVLQDLCLETLLLPPSPSE